MRYVCQTHDVPWRELIWTETLSTRFVLAWLQLEVPNGPTTNGSFLRMKLFSFGGHSCWIVLVYSRFLNHSQSSELRNQDRRFGLDAQIDARSVVTRVAVALKPRGVGKTALVLKFVDETVKTDKYLSTCGPRRKMHSKSVVQGMCWFPPELL